MRKPPDEDLGVNVNSIGVGSQDERVEWSGRVLRKWPRSPRWNPLHRPCRHGWWERRGRFDVPTAPPRPDPPSAARRWREPWDGPRHGSLRPTPPRRPRGPGKNSRQHKAGARHPASGRPRLASLEHPLILSYSWKKRPRPGAKSGPSAPGSKPARIAGTSNDLSDSSSRRRARIGSVRMTETGAFRHSVSSLRPRFSIGISSDERGDRHCWNDGSSTQISRLQHASAEDLPGGDRDAEWIAGKAISSSVDPQPQHFEF
jgi:hypothetical protein